MVFSAIVVGVVVLIVVLVFSKGRSCFAGCAPLREPGVKRKNREKESMETDIESCAMCMWSSVFDLLCRRGRLALCFLRHPLYVVESERYCRYNCRCSCRRRCRARAQQTWTTLAFVCFFECLCTAPLFPGRRERSYS